jgi:hypothetical protein
MMTHTLHDPRHDMLGVIEFQEGHAEACSPSWVHHALAHSHRALSLHLHWQHPARQLYNARNEQVPGRWQLLHQPEAMCEHWPTTPLWSACAEC